MSARRPSPAAAWLAPLRAVVERLRRLLLRRPATRAQLIELLRAAHARALYDRDALDMMEGVLSVSEMRVAEIMVPRAQMEVVRRDETPETYLPRVIESGHSRFPMVDGDKDKVLGVLLAKDLLRYFHRGAAPRRPFSINDFLRPAVFVPESKRLNVLLREFRASRNHMAIVVDEYGGVSGLVTIEDVLEQIVGEIKDEYDFDADDVTIVERGPGEFVVKALAGLDDFNARFHVTLDGEDVDTVGGAVLAAFGRLPRRGEKTVIGDWQFEVLRADSRRVHLLRVTRAAPVAEAADA